MIARLFFTALLFFPSLTQGSELKIVGSIAARSAMLAMQSNFERATGARLEFKWSSATAAAELIKSGERFDIAILTPALMTELSQNGKIADETRAPLARSSVGLAVRKGAPKPDIQTDEGFLKALSGVPLVAVSRDGATGVQFMRTLKDMKLDEKYRNKVLLVDGYKEIDLVAEGKAVWGLQLVSEIVSVEGVDLVGKLPGRFQNELQLQVAISGEAASRPLAEKFLRFILSDEAVQILRKSGMDAY
jgi:molybdate transport system substrate-binding protein